MTAAFIEPSIARRIDRLARRAHAFHRFAHHPLCGSYRGELIAIGSRTRVCRGCTCAISGALAGALLGSLVQFPASAAVAFAMLATAVPILAQRVERDRVQAPLPRVGKLWTRALPLGALALAFVAGLRAHNIAGVSTAVSIALALLVLLRAYRGSGPDRSPCAQCPERTSPMPCSGFRDIVRAERAFVRRSRQVLDGRTIRVARG